MGVLNRRLLHRATLLPTTRQEQSSGGRWSGGRRAGVMACGVLLTATRDMLGAFHTRTEPGAGMV
jgi:hypothetical protein